MMNKAFLYGIFLYEGFASKRSTKRNTKTEEHYKELQLYFDAILCLHTKEFINADYNVFKEIYNVLSTCSIGKYYPYTIQELQNALGINFYNYTGIPGSLWEYPKFHLFITIMQRTVKKNLEIMEAGYSLVRRSEMTRNFIHIHNLPRTLFPELKADNELPFLGLRFDEVEIPAF